MTNQSILAQCLRGSLFLILLFTPAFVDGQEAALPAVRYAFYDHDDSLLVVVGFRGTIARVEAATGSVVDTRPIRVTESGELLDFVMWATYDSTFDRLLVTGTTSGEQSTVRHLLVDFISHETMVLPLPAGDIFTAAAFSAGGDFLVAGVLPGDFSYPRVRALDLSSMEWQEFEYNKDWDEGVFYRQRYSTLAMQEDDGLVFASAGLTWEWYELPDLHFHYAVVSMRGYTFGPVITDHEFIVVDDEGTGIVAIEREDLLPGETPSSALSYPSAEYDDRDNDQRFIEVNLSSAAFDNPIRITEVVTGELVAYTRNEWAVIDVSAGELLSKHEFVSSLYPWVLANLDEDRIYQVEETQLTAYSTQTGGVLWAVPTVAMTNGG